MIREKLKEGLDAVSRLTTENTQLPILKNVLLETSESKLRLTTTNLEMATSYTVFGKVIEHGKITVPFSLLSNITNTVSNVATTLYELASADVPAVDPVLVSKAASWDAMQALLNPPIKS